MTVCEYDEVTMEKDGELEFGDFVLIHYPKFNKLATFLYSDDGVYWFEDESGRFGVSEKYKAENNIVFEYIRDDF